ncbi:response regulator [Maritimibacter sp. UBA3975]|uniref:response regulator n=1 Tax=Maritimibacter sp. UBA3975 TaxID=1946833 RepID=UPI000C0A85D9|nr:response regulator [Maritimibacter sp. UBA3975]MAM63907.1 response regulator [Maritimibacter sp.]|tara:strand:- start:35789 stop:36469 length:681 start_codon:yes stop_codon:yes gene_type:complete
MLDDLLMTQPKPTADKPLAGMTVLVVEDSRFASEAMRLLSVQSGARVRRADCLHSARRHLRVYRPTVVIVDMTLPDGSGEELLRELDAATPRVPVLMGLSGDPDCEAHARASGADGFLAKPVEGVGAFQIAVLNALPAESRPGRLRMVPSTQVHPDPASLDEDLLNACDLLGTASNARDYDYLAQFLHGLALSAHDGELTAAVEAIREDRIEEVEALLKKRLGLIP